MLYLLFRFETVSGSCSLSFCIVYKVGLKMTELKNTWLTDRIWGWNTVAVTWLNLTCRTNIWLTAGVMFANVSIISSWFQMSLQDLWSQLTCQNVLRSSTSPLCWFSLHQKNAVKTLWNFTSFLRWENIGQSMAANMWQKGPISEIFLWARAEKWKVSSPWDFMLKIGVMYLTFFYKNDASAANGVNKMIISKHSSF